MTGLAAPETPKTSETYGALVEPATLRVERLLPGPIDRVWAYLTQSALRRQWLASGDMTQKAGTSFELTWCNDELTDPPGKRPEGMGAVHSQVCRLLAFEPPHKLAFTFGGAGEVLFELAEAGADVRLTLIHSRVPDRGTLLKVGAGWHMHLDVLAARLADRRPEPFWDGWERLKTEYDRRLPG
jgi:uncharacterized protein YndB with AHSA1/START domain